MDSKNIGEGKVVCVTGASGYIASWLVKLLLQRGYTVNATVRNLKDTSKVDHLLGLDGANERLHLFEAELLEEQSFDPAVDGCEGVFHTASPVFLTGKSKEELVDPAVKGTLNVLCSCAKSPSVRRVVITSSTASVICNKNMSTPGAVADETWYSDPEFCEERKDWYQLSKTLAEQAAWKFAKENGIDLVTLHPGLVIGPLLQPTLNFSCEAIVNVIKEAMESKNSGEGKTMCNRGIWFHSFMDGQVIATPSTPLFAISHAEDSSKVDHLLGFDGANERLHLFEAEQLEEQSFDPAIDGCEGVFHTASPLSFTAKSKEELVEPAVEGTLKVLRSCAKSPSVRRAMVQSVEDPG